MPSVAQLSIAPVRSLGLQHPTEIDVTEVGVVEDRRFFLTNDANRLIDQLIVFKLVQVASQTDPEATTLWLRFPDGSVVEGDVELGEAVETPIHGRTGVGRRVLGPWSEALSDFVG
ncbi:MAG TPA: MOSC N-terminal beta barrel domain-containing protein, partial [Candidatus Limnocylindrales bacterium]